MIENKEIRKTGFIMLIISCGFLFFSIWKAKYILLTIFSLMFAFSALFLIIPRRMVKVYQIWTGTTHYIGVFLTSIVLFFVYFLAIVPYSLLLRLLGVDPLTNPKGLKSYWIKRDEQFYDAKRFKELF